MNHTFSTKVWKGNKAVSQGFLIANIVIGTLLMITIVGFLPGAILVAVGIVGLGVNMTTICPNCKKKVSVFRQADAYSCFNCQAVIAKKDNQWKVIPGTNA